jgi:flagellar export protein FliJ
MQQNFRKMKRVQPILKLKKSKVDEETSMLLAIRAEKQKVVREMRESQQKYMKGVEDLNRVRASEDRSNLATLEAALDAVKIHWYTLFKRVQEVENKEKAQVNQLIVAEKDLKSIKNLEDKYNKAFQKDMAKAEQKSLDELAVRRHGQRD